SYSDISAAGSNPTYANWTAATLNVNSVASGNDAYKYQCVVSGTCTPSATSSAATLSILVPPVIDGSQYNPSSFVNTICSGSSTQFGLATSSGSATITYEWQFYNGSSWNDVANGTPTGITY